MRWLGLRKRWRAKDDVDNVGAGRAAKGASPACVETGDPKYGMDYFFNVCLDGLEGGSRFAGAKRFAGRKSNIIIESSEYIGDLSN